MQHPSTSQTDRVFDPYAPPAAPPGHFESTSSVTPGPLYSVNQVALATFFGTPLGGATLMAINEHRLGRVRAVVPTMLCGLLGAAVLLGIAFALPENFPSAPLGLGSLFAVRAIARARQEPALQARWAEGAKHGSSWFAFGVGIASTLVVVVPVLAIAFASAFLGHG